MLLFKGSPDPSSSRVSRRSKLPRICEIVQTGAIAGLAAVPLIADVFRFKATPRLLVAASILAPLGLLSSFWITRTSSRERGLWGAVLTVALYLWAWSTPVMF